MDDLGGPPLFLETPIKCWLIISHSGVANLPGRTHQDEGGTGTVTWRQLKKAVRVTTRSSQVALWFSGWPLQGKRCNSKLPIWPRSDWQPCQPCGHWQRHGHFISLWRPKFAPFGVQTLKGWNTVSSRSSATSG